ncbi:MAG: EAL domain-containing protein [Candidatus Omnitrophica bacterium]|nr:EAL domain-containing protein [Candidatus Omnitrophota bacterium]
MVGSDRKQILIVHNDASYVTALVQTLYEKGFDALTAASSQGAVQKAESLDIDLILLGEEIGNSSGFELCQTLKGTRRTEHIPVVLVITDFKTEHRIKGYHQGADDCFHKDIDHEELFARMQTIWRRSSGVFKTSHENRQREVVQEISRIIDNDLIDPHFQAIYFLKPFRLFGLEILSRPSPGSFITSADELFKTAIKYNMYYPLEMRCWEKAIKMIASRTKSEHLFFNCCPHLVENNKFKTVKDVFHKNSIPIDKVILELTERSAISQYDIFLKHMNQCREMGFRLAVDDVGGGYSSLESIVTTKPEVVKIDIHIIHNAHLDPVKRSIIKFIVAFCRENSITSIAEGIETQEELDVVTELGVDAVQGFYLFRPTMDFNVREMKDVCVSFS